MRLLNIKKFIWNKSVMRIIQYKGEDIECTDEVKMTKKIEDMQKILPEIMKNYVKHETGFDDELRVLVLLLEYNVEAFIKKTEIFNDIRGLEGLIYIITGKIGTPVLSFHSGHVKRYDIIKDVYLDFLIDMNVSTKIYRDLLYDIL